jgi:hypothetical protein
MIDFDRFWMDRPDPYADEDADEAVAEAPPGVTAEEIRAWEEEHGVTLPEPIRAALGRRNGGAVRNTTIEVLPLDRIAPVDDKFWEWTEIDEDEAPNHALMFVFGDETETGATFLMNFNARGPAGEPSVYLDHHGESTYLVSQTIGGLFEAEMAASDEPAVDWSEVEGLNVLARERIDLSPLYDGSPATEEQVLAREGDGLVLFIRQRSPEGQALTRTTLPLPLDAMWAEVRPRRPAPIGTFALHIQPAESDEIVEVRSVTNDDGRWKDTTSRGVPIYVMFESTDRDRLRALRSRLLGDEAAARAQAKQDRQAEFQETLEALSPEQRSAALMQAALNMGAVGGSLGDLADMPPELAQAVEAMRRRLAEMTEQIQKRASANPTDPETIRRIEGYLRDPGAE